MPNRCSVLHAFGPGTNASLRPVEEDGRGTRVVTQRLCPGHGANELVQYYILEHLQRQHPHLCPPSTTWRLSRTSHTKIFFSFGRSFLRSIISLRPFTIAARSCGMLSKFSSVAFFLLWLGFLNLLASASPVPIVLPPSEGLDLFEDVVAREHVDAARRDFPLTREFTEAAEVKRDPIASPDPAPDGEEIDVEARICRFGCL
ncbi:hypothetical protein PAXRUDRAFT_742035 [Paxillus rubicundulus Ve08.2h10]|uniref:Uncharacterized protein n=1 Tax=Paxillus rubicundulus Ve08.2h10 TaxID=930991 RepID=A0A0D0E7V3_9AGAM|nr:hypothetical protein PAXRUDRAFT_742035 [Paxillus rubicundulus Ve08.2h10]